MYRSVHYWSGLISTCSQPRFNVRDELNFWKTCKNLDNHFYALHQRTSEWSLKLKRRGKCFLRHSTFELFFFRLSFALRWEKCGALYFLIANNIKIFNVILFFIVKFLFIKAAVVAPKPRKKCCLSTYYFSM